MVGSINAPATGNTFDAFKANAKNATSSGVRSNIHIYFIFVTHFYVNFFLLLSFIQQGVGFLVGIGASASAPVSPVTSGVSTFGAPTPGADTALPSGTASGTATASGSGGSTDTGSGSAATPTTSSGATRVAAVGSVFAFVAGVLGFAMV